MNFALPALIFNALAQRSYSDIVDPWFLLAYGGGSLLALLTGIVLATALRKTPASDNAFFGLGVSMSNSGFIGYPIVTQVFGDGALVAVALAMLVENLLVLPLTLVLAEMQRRDTTVPAALIDALAATFRNPIVLAICAGLLCSVLELALPAVLARIVDMLASAAAAVALFAVGSALVGARLGHLVVPASLIAAGKLVVHPLAVVLLLQVLPASDAALGSAAVVLAAAPMVTIYPLLAQRYGFAELCAAALVLATGASFVSLNLVLWALGVA